MKMAFWGYCWLPLLLLVTLCSYAQENNLYIQPYEQNLSVRLNAGMPFLVLNQHTSAGNNEYKPNNPLKMGVGFAVKNTLIGLTLGCKFGFLRDKRKGKTESFDFQIHHYASRYVVDLSIQRYSGFYTENESGKEVRLYPGLKIYQYGVQGQYILNRKKFSYKAAFTQSERQVRNAGSALIGGGLYFTDLQTDSVFAEKLGDSYHNFQFGLNGGYAYTWVLRRYWFISASLTLGIHIGNEKIQHFTKRKIEIYPAAFQRVAIGYDHDHWSVGFTSVNNLTYFSESLNKGSNLFSGNIQFTYIRRFYLTRKPFRIRNYGD